jgi:hypothetical protein
METTQLVSVDESRSKARPSKGTAERFFYSGSAILLFLFMLWGFHLFYFHGRAYPGRPLTPPIRPLLIAHGIGMTAWMVLFIVQPLLIAAKNVRLHMKLGLFGAGLAAAVTVLGINVALGAARVNPPELKLWGLAPKQFLLVSSSAIVLFAVFTAIGILKRRKSDIHRPMMLLASLAALPPSLDRVAVIHNLFEGTVPGTLFGAYSSSLVMGLLLLGLHWVLTRKLNRAFAIGFAAIVAVALASMQLAPGPAWAGISDLLVK